MRFLVIGLGSMGRRRLRNLIALGHTEIAGFDPRSDRRDEAAGRYGVAVFDEIEAALAKYAPDALIVSTSPAHHMTYAWLGLERGLPCFIEASVTDAERIRALHERTRKTPLLMAPSCTMRYFPGPRKVKELVRAGVVGRPLNVNYQTGQYLPDWHPWEPIGSYYVSRRETGAGREIVPFELTWLNDIFGAPEPLACAKAKLTDLDADIDDIYHCLLRYPDGILLNMTVEVISRPRPMREFRLLGSTGTLVFSADEACVRYATAEHPDWVHIALGQGTVEQGYVNPEEPYIAELRDFVTAATKGDKSLFPNTLMDDYEVLRTLERLESLSESM